jgi:tetratricopeptide (TPR) repeat protein
MAPQELDFQQAFQAGQTAFERGNYRASVDCLEAASQLTRRHSRAGGEARLWLAAAYQAAGQTQAALDLCRALQQHPSPNVRKQGKDMRYILEAPSLQRPARWMTSMPDFSALADSEPRDRRGGSSRLRRQRAQGTRSEPESLDWSEVNTQDNRFTGAALVLSALGLMGLLWWS